VMSENGPAYVSKAFAKAFRTLGLRRFRTRPTPPEPTGKPRGSSRLSARNGHMSWPSRTPRSATVASPATCRSITGSGSTQLWTGFHHSNGSLSCSAEEPGETQHLVASNTLQPVIEAVQTSTTYLYSHRHIPMHPILFMIYLSFLLFPCRLSTSSQACGSSPCYNK